MLHHAARRAAGAARVDDAGKVVARRDLVGVAHGDIRFRIVAMFVDQGAPVVHGERAGLHEAERLHADRRGACWSGSAPACSALAIFAVEKMTAQAPLSAMMCW